MSLREKLNTRSAELVKRERVTLPESGLEVQVRGLMQGEVRRSGEHARATAMQIAFSVEDPETGNLVWNPTDAGHLDEIDGLHTIDSAVILEASNRLSGMEQLKKFIQSRETKNSLSGSSDSESAGEP